MSKRTVKPAACPFCASTQVTVAGEFARAGEPDRTFVQCKACGARGPYIAIDRKDDAAAAAVWEWNKRDFAGLAEAFKDLLAHMAGAASAYRLYALRHESIRPRARPDPMFTTRADDFDKAVERAREAWKKRDG